MTDKDLYSLARLDGFELWPTGVDKGVMVVCKRHENEVSAMIVNSVGGAPSLASLAFMAGEHEAEHHGGPPMPEPDGTDG
jgi:hypothetical protein